MDNWFEVQEEVCAFARVLVKSNVDRTPWSAMDVVRFFETPWKWDIERTAWVAAGRPEEWS